MRANLTYFASFCITVCRIVGVQIGYAFESFNSMYVIAFLYHYKGFLTLFTFTQYPVPTFDICSLNTLTLRNSKPNH